ncbi:MAG: cell division/cell wall cluster transcriptional repressor MraZ [Acidimicrobiales bacterium]
MDRFVGRYEHSLDTKGRLVLPARLRPAFDVQGGYLAKGPEGCLALWPHDRYQRRLADLEEQAEEAATPGARAKERLFSSAEPVTPDQQGRIPVAPYLQEFARLDPARILVRGANKVVELWNPQRWEQIEAAAEQDLLGVDAAAVAAAS